MDRITPVQHERHSRNGLTLYIHGILVLILLAAGFIGIVRWHIIGSTLIGMVMAAAGGTAIGCCALRLLGHHRHIRDILTGLILTTGIGTLTIGYLYIFYIKGPVSSIGTPDRAVKQVFIFVEFLVAQASGIAVAKSIFPNQPK
ncbi:MAG: hypothetical protein P1S60_08395 [Anaerolineae bacterium]|nr:hypothetical protein [Anaerolineae bacterium]